MFYVLAKISFAYRYCVGSMFFFENKRNVNNEGGTSYWCRLYECDDKQKDTLTLKYHCDKVTSSRLGVVKLLLVLSPSESWH